MYRAVVLACLCAPFAAGLLRQAEAARSQAATRAERDQPGAIDPGAIDPTDPPRDPLVDSAARACSPDLAPVGPSPLDGLLPPPGSGPVGHRPVERRSAEGGPAPPPPSTRLRLCRLQVFRN